MVAGLIVESEVRGMVRWGERLDERCEDERARQPVVRTPGNPHFGTGPASVKILFKPQGDCKYWLGDDVIMCSTQLPNIGCLGYSPHIRVSSSVKPKTHEFGLPTGDYLSASRRFCVIQLTLNRDQESSIGRQPSKNCIQVICLYFPRTVT